MVDEFRLEINNNVENLTAWAGDANFPTTAYKG